MRIADAEEERNDVDTNGNGEFEREKQPRERENGEPKMIRRPQPKFWRDVLVSDSEELEDSNTTHEVSKVEFLKVFGPPFMEVSVTRTVGGDRQTVVEQAPLWRFDKNRIDLQERGSPLVIGENQSLIVTLVNPRRDTGNLHASVHVEKDQLKPSSSRDPRRRY